MIIGIATGERAGERRAPRRASRRTRLPRGLRHALDVIWSYAPEETTTAAVLIVIDSETGQARATVTWREDGVVIGSTERVFHCERAVCGSWNDLASALVVAARMITHSLSGDPRISAATSETDKSRMISFVTSPGTSAHVARAA